MSRESKIITAGVHNVEKTIQIYESFGWELLSINGSQIAMTRESQIPVYADLVKHQANYEDLLKKYNSITYPSAPQKPEEFEMSKCLIRLVCLIFPGVLYIVDCVKKNKEYEKQRLAHKEAIAAIEKQKKEILAEAEQVALNSRAIFFGKQG